MFIPVVFLSALIALPATAATPQQLLSQGALSARAYIETAEPYYQRAPLILVVEVATPRWFSRGTQVRDFRVSNAIVRPVASFADNLTERRGAQSWSLQRWRFRVFPQRAGTLVLPALRVYVSVDAQEQGVVEGELRLASPAPRIELPPQADPSGDWVAVPALTVTETWEGLLDVYRPGDAITRIRRYRLEDAPAMLLPGSTTPAIPGLSLYHAPPQLSEESNRGRLTGLREERLVITVEQPGSYTVPGLRYRWFDTRRAAMQTLSLEPFAFTAEAAAGDAHAPGTQSLRRGFVRNADLVRGLAWLIATALVLLALIALLRHLARQPAIAAQGAHLARAAGQWKTRRRFRRAARAQDAQRCLSLLYSAMCQRGETRSLSAAVRDNPVARDTLRGLLAKAYAPAGTAGFPDTAGLKTLWASVCHKGGGTPGRRLAMPRINPPPTQS